MLINLIKNALKFTNEGEITLQASYNTDTSTLEVDVKDTGAGIALSDFPKLFTRWGKLHRTAEQNSEGLGLGLKIVEEIVKLNCGTI